MINDKISENIIFNIDKIYDNMNVVFDISREVFVKIIVHILSIDKEDSFYKGLIKPEIITCFKKENLTKLKNYLKSMNFDKEVIKKIIITIPEIILFSNKCIDIFPLFKSYDFKGIVLLNNNKYKAYDYYENSYHHNVGDTKIYRINQGQKRSPVQESETIVKSMLESLSRKDIMDYYCISETSSLEDKFYALSSTYNKRNYYFYKVENPLIGLKAKLTTYKKDKKYHCDICGEGIEILSELKTYHITPLHEHGVDEIYNIVCLCDNCYSFINSKNNDEEYRDKLIEILKLRIEKTLPEYLNTVNSYFGIVPKKKK